MAAQVLHMQSSDWSSNNQDDSENPTLMSSSRSRSMSRSMSRRSSTCSLDQCINGHQLILVPVRCERNTICGGCCTNIRIRPINVLCYHCTECDFDSCADCLTEDMMAALICEREKANSEIPYIDANGEGLYKGQLSPCAKREGHGKMEWTGEASPIKGGTYEGFWKDDKREGHGKYVYPDGGSYEGLWENDLKCGYGRRSFSNGFKYHGEFKNGMKNGKGIFKGVTGRWCFAVWKNDQMVGPGRFPAKAKPSVGVEED